MKEITLLPTTIVGLLALWVGTLGLWAVEAQMKDDDTGPSVSGRETRIQWKLVTTWPKGLPGLGSAPENFAHRVGEMSDGRLTIRVYGAGELVPPLGVFDAVKEGALPRWGMEPRIIGKEGPGLGFLYSGAIRYDCARNEWLAPLRRWSGVMERVIRALMGLFHLLVVLLVCRWRAGLIESSDLRKIFKI